MVLFGMLVVALTVYFTGPAGREQLERRRARQRALDDRPTARVVFLLPGDCRCGCKSCARSLHLPE